MNPSTAYRGPIIIPRALIEHLIACGLTTAERMVALIALSSARMDRDTGLWLLRWSTEYSARFAGTSPQAASGAKAKLDAAGAIVLRERANRDEHKSELYDVTPLIEMTE